MNGHTDRQPEDHPEMGNYADELARTTGLSVRLKSATADTAIPWLLALVGLALLGAGAIYCML